MSDQSIFIRLLTIELMIPHARSLKEKRSPLHGLKDRIRRQFNASVAEVGYQDKWQRAVIAVCLVGCNRQKLESVSAKICSLCAQTTDLEILAIDQQWL